MLQIYGALEARDDSFPDVIIRVGEGGRVR
jgi:hypothetical protein